MFSSLSTPVSVRELTIVTSGSRPGEGPQNEASHFQPNTENGSKNLEWQDHEANIRVGFGLWFGLHHSLHLKLLLRDGKRESYISPALQGV